MNVVKLKLEPPSSAIERMEAEVICSTLRLVELAEIGARKFPEIRQEMKKIEEILRKYDS